MAACPKCSTRKAKRSCPALAQVICAPCCAGLRMIECPCPETCVYLKDARSANMERRLPRLAHHLRAGGKEGLLDTVLRLRNLVFILERAIVEVQRYKFPDLTDEEALAGVENAIKTVDTLDRGIIYEHTSESPRIQAVTRKILDALDDVKKKLQDQQQSGAVKTREVLDCLHFVSESIQFGDGNEKGKRPWIRSAALFQPYPEKETQSLIVPG